ncbi:MAG: chorismate synthase [Spirochaetes bacterium]|nr:chorismate synthase [Spirochaetota bacterium]MBU0956549.1 chorismate synthase [Spirochaetota bacterium]
MNSFGRIFRVSLFGESHGSGCGALLDGCPPGLSLQPADFAEALARRRPGSPGTTARIETDAVQFLSGVFNGYTTGAPLALFFVNTQQHSADYSSVPDIPRPGHADWTAQQKYRGFQDYRGGGHFSGRLTVALVAAGVVAAKLLPGISLHAALLEIGGRPLVEKDAVLSEAIKRGDSVGAIIECRATGLPAGLGEPFFDSLESLLAHALFSIPGVRGLEFGSGFRSAAQFGSEHNDPLISADGRTSSNNSGGINGGISNGNELCFRLAVKPTATLSRPQTSINLKSGQPDTCAPGGRHDSCFALRVPVIVEALTALVLADLTLLHNTARMSSCT